MVHFHLRMRVGSVRLGGVVKVRFGAAQLRLAFPPPTVPLFIPDRDSLGSYVSIVTSKQPDTV